MLTKLKKQVQHVLSSQAKIAHRIGLTPNKVSIVGFILAVFSAVAYGFGQTQPLSILLATAFLLASGYCDTLDGILARNYQQITAFGGFLDSVLDRYADGAVYTGIILGGLCNPLAGIIALTGSLLVSYTRARAEAAGVKMESIGIAERAERMIILAIASIAAFFWLPSMNIGIILLAVLANFTVLQRGLHAYKLLKKKENE